MKKILILVPLFVFLPSSVSALTYSCLDNWTSNVSTATEHLYYVQCPDGCDSSTGRCYSNALMVWNYTARNLTYYPPLIPTFDIDISKSGYINMTVYDNVEPQYFYGEETPTEDLGTDKNYYQKVYTVMPFYPSNITNGYMRIWLKKDGAPTGNLQVWINDAFAFNITASTISTSMTQYEYKLSSGNFTDRLIKVELRGEVDWDKTNNIKIGYSDKSGIMSYKSDDGGTTWKRTKKENALGFFIEYYAEPIPNILSKNQVGIITSDIKRICPGDDVVINFMFKNFKGNTLKVNNYNMTCDIKQQFSNGTRRAYSDVNDITPNIIIVRSECRKHITVTWNNTDEADTDTTYFILCNGTFDFDEIPSVTELHHGIMFSFSNECNINTNVESLSVEHSDTNEVIESIESDTKNIPIIKNLVEAISVGITPNVLVYGLGIIAVLELIAIVILLYIMSEVKEKEK